MNGFVYYCLTIALSLKPNEFNDPLCPASTELAQVVGKVHLRSSCAR